MITNGSECIACNGEGAKEYELSIRSRETGQKDVDVPLCGVCADEHLTVDWIRERTAD